MQYDPKTAFFTICSNNYMPFAKVLMESISAVHPQARRVIALADEKLPWPGFYDGPFDVIEARALGIENFRHFAFRYDIMEFNTAIKPFVFDHLLSQPDIERVFYIDPDIFVFSPLDTLIGMLAEGASFLLTPHLHAPAENEADPTDLTIMRAGVYNLGFLGVSDTHEARDLIRWWMRRLEHGCLNAQSSGIFVDQKFMDLIPGFSPAARIVHDPGLNVAYWNLGQVRLSGGDGAWLVNEQPLGFFHFSGFDPRRTENLSKHSRNFRGRHAPALASLLEFYARRLLDAGYGNIPAGAYSYGRFTSGCRIPELVRRMFRERTPDWAGDPFDTYEAYLHAAAPVGSRDARNLVFTNFMHYLWQHFDNQRLIRDPERIDHLRDLTLWYLRHARREQHLDHRLIEPVARRFGAFVQGALPACDPDDAARTDVSVIGYLRTTSGVGVVARHTLQALASSGLRVDGLDVDLGVVSDRSDRGAETLIGERAEGRVQLFANVNADQLPLVLAHLEPHLAQPAYRIGMPAWELEEFPDAWLEAFDGVQEVWAQTLWVQRMLAARLDKPVVYMPVCLDFDFADGLPRETFGLPADAYIYYFSFDFLSFIERKNPEAAIAAFRLLKARLGDDRKVALAIKTLNANRAAEKFAALQTLIGNDPDIHMLDRVLTRHETLSLISSCDCVVSLHRCEGLGLLVAEAMALEIPVIATDYAATTELLTPQTGYPVDYRLVAVPPGAYPMSDGQMWAQADIAHASRLMEQVLVDPEAAAEKARTAKHVLALRYGAEAVTGRQLARLAELGGG